MREIVERTAAAGDLRALRLLGHEVAEMTIALTPGHRAALEAQLRDRLGVDVDAERAAMRRHVAEILARGTIAGEKERRRLAEYRGHRWRRGGDLRGMASARGETNLGLRT